MIKCPLYQLYNKKLFLNTFFNKKKFVYIDLYDDLIYELLKYKLNPGYFQKELLIIGYKIDKVSQLFINYIIRNYFLNTFFNKKKINNSNLPK